MNLKYGKRTACRDNFFTENAVFSREAGKRSKTRYKSQPVEVFCDGQTYGQMNEF